MKRMILGLLMTALGATAGAADIAVSGAWVRLLPGNMPAAGYVELTNNGSASVNLNKAESPAFGDIELHRSSEHNGVASMEHVHSISMQPGETIALAPQSYHLMMFGRSGELKVGGQIPITLGFSDGSNVVVDFTLRDPSGQ